jgi:hypothetical protein
MLDAEPCGRAVHACERSHTQKNTPKTRGDARNTDGDALYAIEIVPYGRDHDLRAAEIDRYGRDNDVRALEDALLRAVNAP